ncbi:hypothetical protein HPP92_022531 [Vanilla planifolia]|uniref:Uncharacterized protein n=1 Tax=Vanilla planifolia TaxID=51239 RepID=A0A835PUX5_VANPL|nr:hypothetical protein HPP92_022798 [Vanilla planifolia]KAG0459403.1 hypothetical protein HPP92_022531 [Vanilla planifolia]
MTVDGRTPTWKDRIETLTHILMHPTTTPSLHSQLFVAARVPCFIRWDYPPFLCSDGSLPLLRWSCALLFRRLTGIGQPARSSWRSKCPFQQPPPLVLSSAEQMAPSRWTPEELRARLRRRIQRGRLGLRVPPMLAVGLPILFLLRWFFSEFYLRRSDSW